MVIIINLELQKKLGLNFLNKFACTNARTHSMLMRMERSRAFKLVWSQTLLIYDIRVWGHIWAQLLQQGVFRPMLLSDWSSLRQGVLV